MAITRTLETVELCTASDPTASVIWLHGLGADGHDFVPVVKQFDLPARPALRFVFPHAPVIPVTINGGAQMRAWYDIRHPNLDQYPDEAGIRASTERLETLIENEQHRGVPAQRVVVAGFSQGGAIALFGALRHRRRLGGLMAISTYVPLLPKLGAEASDANRDLPIFMAHGQYDTLIPLGLAAAGRDALRALGYPVEWREYPVAHGLCPQQVVDIGAWLGAQWAAMPD
ncbi:MAG: alpha/beta hydrolase [Burkholderiales bacterium]